MKATLEERFDMKLMPVPDGCVLWNAGQSHGGYGKFWGANGHMHAHRWAWIHQNGPVPEGHQIHHTCGQRLCVNVDHLVALSPKDHMALHRVTHCKRGHEFTEANTRHRSRAEGGRACRRCNRERMQKTRQIRPGQ